MAIDLETVGSKAQAADSRVTGIGIAGPMGNFYIGVQHLDGDAFAELTRQLRRHSWMAHNVMFDGAFLQKLTGEWLDFRYCTFGLYKQLATEGHPTQTWGLKDAQRQILLWPESNEADVTAWLAERGLAKDQMGLVPTEILGPYCAKDAEACWLLYGTMNSVLEEHPTVRSYHTDSFIPLVRLLAEQQFRGIAVDVTSLGNYEKKLEQLIVDLDQKFRDHPMVAPHIADFERDAYETYLRNTPRGKLPPTSDRFRFNTNSKPQMEWLFYDRLGYKPSVVNEETGRRSIDKKVLPAFGEPGVLLTEYNKKVKELGYVRACLSHVVNGVLHPQFKAPGTLTGRLAGDAGFNLQQQPKTREYLSCLRARPGHKFVQLDFTAVEPIVLTEFSKDPALMSIYGPGAKPNDVYLFTAAKIRGLGDEILKYYDPANPTKEGIAAAKKACKKDRNTAKTVQLAKTYNAGAKKIHQTLEQAGIVLPLNDVYRICKEFDKVYAGVTAFKHSLEREWTDRGGWIFNGIGRPQPIAPFLVKDAVNRFCQSTGHDLLIMYIAMVDKIRRERQVHMWPVIVDFHDETIWEAPEAHTEAAAQVLRDGLAQLNALLQPTIPIKGEVLVCDTLADVKVED